MRRAANGSKAHREIALAGEPEGRSGSCYTHPDSEAAETHTCAQWHICVQSSRESRGSPLYRAWKGGGTRIARPPTCVMGATYGICFVSS